jgi:signal transduction histidine kinase
MGTAEREATANSIEKEGRGRARTVASAVRVLAAAALMLVAGLCARRHHAAPYLFVGPPMGYFALATLLFLWRGTRTVAAGARVMAFLDIGMVYLVVRTGMSVDESVWVASWMSGSLAIFTLVVALVGLSMPARWTIAQTTAAIAAQSALLLSHGSGAWPAILAGTALATVALASSAVPRLSESARRQSDATDDARRDLAAATEANRRLERLQKDKDTLLELIVHDMRSPANATLLSLEFLDLELHKRPDTEALLEALVDALNSANKLNGMISQILDTSKLESGRITLHIHPTSARQLLERARDELISEARNRSVHIDVDAPDTFEVGIDARLFPRLLANLGSFVLRRAPAHGRILLAATSGSGETRLSIHASGLTIPAARREVLFDKFHQDGKDDRAMSGWGLGLYFCRLVAESHHGSIVIEDVAGWDLSFVVRLPSISS